MDLSTEQILDILDPESLGYIDLEQLVLNN